MSSDVDVEVSDVHDERRTYYELVGEVCSIQGNEWAVRMMLRA